MWHFLKHFYRSCVPGYRVVGPGKPKRGQPEHCFVVTLVKVKGWHILHCLSLCQQHSKTYPFQINFVLTQCLAEMEVTEMILAKVSRLCQLSIHCRGFLSKLQIFKSIGPRLCISWGRGAVFVYLFHFHKIPSYDTKMTLKVVFDTTAFVKFKISNNF